MNVSVGKLAVKIADEFTELFIEFCDHQKLEWNELETTELDTVRRFEIEYKPNLDLEYENIDEELTDFPWVVADILKKVHGEEDLRA